MRRKGEAVLQEGLSSMPKVTQLLRPVTGHRLDAEVLNFFFSFKKVNIYRYNFETAAKFKKKKKKSKQLTKSVLIKVRCRALPVGARLDPGNAARGAGAAPARVAVCTPDVEPRASASCSGWERPRKATALSPAPLN